ncbi:MAG: nuclear transport factor 2 family protein [Frankiaceae bacterium]|nr:nuclear transport factor 2 family protein [Frankiaceae bacterium]
MGAQENKAVVATAYEAFGRGDLEGVFAVLADDVVWTNHATGAPHEGEFLGVDGARRFFAKLLETVEITQFDIQTLLAEDDLVVALGTSAFTVNGSGNKNEGPLVHVFRFVDGKVATFDEYEHVDSGVW